MGSYKDGAWQPTACKGHGDPDNSGQCIHCGLILDSLEDAIAALPRYFIDDSCVLEQTDDKRLGRVMRTEDVLLVIDEYK